ncbi:MAG TPA: hypothetical protein VL442_13245 [Mucilaginibacter sp.]|nr:hypothetical protein [Mucilaginibacter sp.]
MTFEEFFKKKKINLVALEQGEPGLFSEFKVHFEKMGEKSFDHTKKYWFNKLRLRFPVPPEPKVEKVVIENPLAEQTITETLTEKPATPAPKVGFTPRFKAGATKPAEPTPEPEAKPDTEKTETSASAPTGFKPRFKAGVTKPTEPTNTEPTHEHEKPVESEKPASVPVGFKPRFKAGATKPAAPVEPNEKIEEPKTEPEKSVEEEKPASLGFKPRFKVGVTKSVNPSPEQKGEPKEGE